MPVGSGSENDLLYAANADFSGIQPAIANGLATNGQLWVGTTAVNVGGTHINVGTLTSPGATVNIGYSSPNITLDVANPLTTSVVFSAYLTATQANVTGDGTNYEIPFNATFVNVGGSFNTGTGRFTAPVTGYYMFSFGIQISDLDISHTQIAVGIGFSNTPTKTLYSVSNTNPFISSFGGEQTYTGSGLIPLNAGDQMIINVDVFNGGKTVDVFSNWPTDNRTFFTGFLIH